MILIVLASMIEHFELEEELLVKESFDRFLKRMEIIVMFLVW